MGGNKKIGVFATRASFRPNHLGLSVLKLDKIEATSKETILHLSGIDLVDGTPVVDIKPYLPYADIVNTAENSLADCAPAITPVDFSEASMDFIKNNQNSWRINLKDTITEILQQNPQPAYQSNNKTYGTRLYDCNIIWQVNVTGAKKSIHVLNIQRYSQ